jgi:hypothetical protein
MHEAEQLFGGDHLPVREVFPAVGCNVTLCWCAIAVDKAVGCWGVTVVMER